MGNDKETATIVNVYEGGQVNVAYDNSTINAMHDNAKDWEKERIGNNEKIIKKVQNLIMRGEYERAKELLFELETNNLSGEEAFLKNLYLGKCYIYLAQDLKESKKKSHLREGLCCLKEAQDNWKNQKEEYIYDFYFLYTNACLQLSELERTIDYYKMGIDLYDKGILKDKIKSIDDPQRYRLYLDYALLLDGASYYSSGKEAKDYLIKESECYFIIGTLEELIDKGIDYESAYRYFANAGRCFEQLLEFSEEDFEQLADNAIESYNNALDSRLTSLSNHPDRYGLIYNNLGNIYSRLISERGRIEAFEVARDCYDKALKAYENIDDKMKYYECFSNKARLLASNYKRSGTEEDFEEVKDLLKDIIKERKKIGDISGSYLSNFQLAQLYFDGGVKNNDICRLKKSMTIYSDILEFYTKEYVPDKYFKGLYGKYRASCYLADVQKDIKTVEENIYELLDILLENKDILSAYLISLYADLVKNSFFFCVGWNGYSDDKLSELYIKIKTIFESLNLNIEDYIIIE